MAKDTNIELRNKVIYSIYVRNYCKNGNFKDVEKDVERIKALGTDIIWFMPIHPIGVKNKKGTLGCPYAIQDYRKVNPEYGTLEDFKNLVKRIHEVGMKCIIDVVYGHTSPDSWLLQNKPEYFYRDKNGNLGNKVGDWTDIVDLDYKNKELWDYQIETLKMWAEIVDGFRCDVAPLLPMEFWKKAREEVSKVNKDCIWLAETVHGSFIKDLRDRGFVAHSDCETFEAFDICYDYDIQPYYEGYIKGKNTLTAYIDRLNLQETIYPHNYVKLHFLENHDNPRAKKLIPDKKDLTNWTSFLYFQKGSTLIYAGQEAEDQNCPSHFDIDKVNWDNLNCGLTELMSNLKSIKENNIPLNAKYDLKAFDEKDTVVGCYEKDDIKVLGVFNLCNSSGDVKIDALDGEYINLLTKDKITVNDGKVNLEKCPMIFEIK